MERDPKSQRTSKYSVLAAEKAADGAGISLSEAEAISDAGGGCMRSSFPTKLETGRSIQIPIESAWVGDDGEPGEDETGYARGAGFCGERV